MFIKKRSFAKVLLLYLFTFGLYHLFFIYRITTELNHMDKNDPNPMSPSLSAWLTFFTCGFYALFWYYTIGSRMKRLGQQNDVFIEEGGLSYLIWYLIGSITCGIGIPIVLYLFLKNYNALVVTYLQRTNDQSAPNFL